LSHFRHGVDPPHFLIKSVSADSPRLRDSGYHSRSAAESPGGTPADKLAVFGPLRGPRERDSHPCPFALPSTAYAVSAAPCCASPTTGTTSSSPPSTTSCLPPIWPGGWPATPCTAPFRGR